MNIAGKEIAMPKVNWAGTIQTTAMWGIIGIVIIAIGIWLFFLAKNKGVYKYPVTLRVRRANGTKVRYDLLGGIVEGKNGVKEFKIKVPKTKKKFNLGYMPDFSKADALDRLSFIQEGDSTLWQQTTEEIVIDKVIEIKNEKGELVEQNIYRLLIEPIPTDTKTSTYNNLQATRELMDIKKLTAWGISILAFVIMVVAHLMSLYFQTKIKCGVPVA